MNEPSAQEFESASGLAPAARNRATSSRGLNPDELHPLARLPEEWAAVLELWGERTYRARQIFRWLQGRGELDPDKMTDLSRSLRQRLKDDGLSGVSELAEMRRSADGTRKLLLRLTDQRLIECVLIPMTSSAWSEYGSGDDESSDDETSNGDERPDCEQGGQGDSRDSEIGARLAARIAGDAGDGKKRRVTLCVSTQHGCAMGCVFCASGRSGLNRGLGAAEIVAQVLEARRHLEADEILTNLVFMGMGEPLHHYEETARAIRLLSEDDGVGLGLRRMTVSTVGLIGGIERLGKDFDGKVGLAVSLHAPNDALRSRIVPINERINLQSLIQALTRYPLPRRRRITIEYTLIAGVNDERAHAQELARLLRPLRVKINLLAMNPVAGVEWQGASNERVAAFRDRLVDAGYSCFVRTRRGDDVAAACGQLALRGNRPRAGE